MTKQQNTEIMLRQEKITAKKKRRSLCGAGPDREDEAPASGIASAPWTVKLIGEKQDDKEDPSEGLDPATM